MSELLHDEFTEATSGVIEEVVKIPVDIIPKIHSVLDPRALDSEHGALGAIPSHSLTGEPYIAKQAVVARLATWRERLFRGMVRAMAERSRALADETRTAGPYHYYTS